MLLQFHCTRNMQLKTWVASSEVMLRSVFKEKGGSGVSVWAWLRYNSYRARTDIEYGFSIISCVASTNDMACSSVHLLGTNLGNSSQSNHKHHRVSYITKFVDPQCDTAVMSI
jgi:hypothetical protein